MHCHPTRRRQRCGGQLSTVAPAFADAKSQQVGATSIRDDEEFAALRFCSLGGLHRMVANILNAIRMVAFKMARSGDFVNCQAIETELERRGYERVRLALRHPITRAHLDQLCIERWQGNEERLLREWSME